MVFSANHLHLLMEAHKQIGLGGTASKRVPYSGCCVTAMCGSWEASKLVIDSEESFQGVSVVLARSSQSTGMLRN